MNKRRRKKYIKTKILKMRPDEVLVVEHNADVFTFYEASVLYNKILKSVPKNINVVLSPMKIRKENKDKYCKYLKEVLRTLESDEVWHDNLLFV